MSQVTMHLLRVGACRHLECMAARGGRWAPVSFPALCALIHHPAHGWILYDTGYAGHFEAATRPWPEHLYRLALPVQLPQEEILATQLGRLGLRPQDIATVIISHYHGDHIAGLRDFPNARFIALQRDTEHIAQLRGRRWRATLNACLPALLPEDFFSRVHAADASPPHRLPAWMAPFASGFDLLGDASLLGIPLAGHSQGQLGLFMPQANGRPTFLIADACWSLPALREGRLPAPPAMLLQARRGDYIATFRALNGIAHCEPAVALLPSHCSAAWEAWQHEH